MDDYPQG